MSEKVGLCAGRLYRGLLIYSKATGETFILNEAGFPYDFSSMPEAEMFVDTCLTMSVLLIGSLS